MLPQLSNYIIEKWPSLHFHRDKPKKISFLGISGSVEGGTTTFLVFLNKDKKPTFVIRVLRDQKKLEQFLNERDVLLKLNSLSLFLKDSVPKLISCENIASRWALVESVIDGKPMEVNVTSNGLPEIRQTKINFELVKEWLINFDKETKEPILDPQRFNEKIKKEIKIFRETFQLSEREKIYSKKVEKKIDDFEFSNLFLLHGDLCCQNILVSNSKIGVIDWMSSERSPLVLSDFFFFLCTYYLQERKKTGLQSYLQAFKNTFFSFNPYSKLVKENLKKYCQELQIDFSFISFYLAVFLIKKAVSEYENIASLAKEGFIPRFPIYLQLKRNYEQALKEQIWRHFFRFLVKEEKSLII